MKPLKDKFKYVNQWKLLFWASISIQVLLTISRELDFLETVWSCVILWCFYMLGYNGLDRELEIKLDQAKEAIAKESAGV